MLSEWTTIECSTASLLLICSTMWDLLLPSLAEVPHRPLSFLLICGNHDTMFFDFLCKLLFDTFLFVLRLQLPNIESKKKKENCLVLKRRTRFTSFTSKHTYILLYWFYSYTKIVIKSDELAFLQKQQLRTTTTSTTTIIAHTKHKMQENVIYNNNDSFLHHHTFYIALYIINFQVKYCVSLWQTPQFSSKASFLFKHKLQRQRKRVNPFNWRAHTSQYIKKRTTQLTAS